MHIPDGYLSPSTCALAYAVAVPFWMVALRKVRDLLQTRLVPLLAVVAAFCFVLMMLNLPLPGGTSGHAVGLAVAPILLGPWPAVLAISIALFVQALFFGDGGITTFGANSLDMAVVGPLLAYGLYRLISGRAPLISRRRVLAAGLAGYVGINLAALLAALLLGVQPLWFHDADGTPLYAPYPLTVAVPAMLVGHLTIGGLAEALISAGILAYLQKTDPGLLRASAPGVPLEPAPGEALGKALGWRRTRALWALVGVLMVASPLGLLAAGMAWGEWSAADFQDPMARGRIAQASSNVVPPPVAPQGMACLASLWTAPIPDYAPAFMHNASFGYLMSAMLGTGLILLTTLGLTSLLRSRSGPQAPRGP
jgi:cobalt/nickel transport system permease protein